MNSTTHSILVVDDDFISLRLYQTILDDVGVYKIYTAASAEDALKIFTDSTVDLLITDIDMPGMNGIELIVETRKISDDFLALVLTGAEDTETAIAALNAGAFGYMQKPVNKDELIAHVCRALEYLDMTRDLTIQKESNLRHAMMIHGGRMAALGEMASALAHEINQPLNIMSIIVQGWELLAGRGRLEMDKVLTDVDKIRANIERISTLIDHVRCLGHQGREMVKIYPSEVIARAVDLCKVQFDKHSIDLQVVIKPGIPAILGVANELEQVIINLIANARHAIEMRKDNDDNFRGKIEVLAECHDKLIKIIVQDNGGGMPALVARKVFEPFFSTKPMGEGTGLGLSISREIVEKFNGTITLDNQPDSGARFEIQFPLLTE